MSLAVFLIVVGIILAIFVHYALGLALVLIGLVLLVWPAVSTRRGP